MKKIITYGTYDVFHRGHYNLLKNAKALGDYLIVGVTTENYDKYRGKMNVKESLMERVENVKSTGLADKIIIEEYEGQKIDDIQKYNVDIFAIGSDWKGKFDYLNELCTVIYLPRTKGISSTQIREKFSTQINLGMIGAGRIAGRFVAESKFVSGVEIVSVFCPDRYIGELFVADYEINKYTDDIDEFLNDIDAVYIASPHGTHYKYACNALESGKHVLCEKPITLKAEQAAELYKLANDNKLVLIEAVKTAFCPGFMRLMSLVKSGAIGRIKSIDACFTKLVFDNLAREMDKDQDGGSMTELGTYCLLPIVKIFGTDFLDSRFVTMIDDLKEVDLFTKGDVIYKIGVGSFKVGLGVKSEGELIISGTNGYAYVPSPWWKTDYFEIRYEDLNKTQKHFYRFEGDGLRYELDEFIRLISEGTSTSYKYTPQESITATKILENYINKYNTRYIS